MKRLLFLVASIVFSGVTSAQGLPCLEFDNVCATPSLGGSSKEVSTRIYTGLSWELGGNQGMTPDFVLGVRSITVKNTDSVTGGDFSFKFKLKNSSVSLDSTRLAYVGGKRNSLVNVGLGYSNTHSTPISTLAVQGNYLRISTDYQFYHKKFQFFGEINTLEKPTQVKSNQLNCSNGYVLTDANAESVFYGTYVPSDGSIVDGKTCLGPSPD